MKATMLLGAIAGAVTFACGDSSPTAPDRMGPLAPSSVVADAAGLEQQGIGGTIELVGVLPPGRAVVTPSGICHFWNLPVITRFTGDVQGEVTIHENMQGPCAGGRLAAAGPFEGEVTYRGLSGGMTGQWNTNCKFDLSVGRPSCDGTMNARGTGGLDGVSFHFKWGPGFYPFPYTGTAFSK